jgi:hypothetical protein
MGTVNITTLIQKNYITHHITIVDDIFPHDLDIEKVVIPDKYLEGMNDASFLFNDDIKKYIYNYHFKYPKRKRVINKLLEDSGYK